MFIIPMLLALGGSTAVVLKDAENRLTRSNNGQKYIYNLTIDDKYHVVLYSNKDSWELEHALSFLTEESGYISLKYADGNVNLLKSEIKSLKFSMKIREIGKEEIIQKKKIEEKKEFDEKFELMILKIGCMFGLISIFLSEIENGTITKLLLDFMRNWLKKC
ncbi:hypothetical protein M2139_001518 [Enterococcus sp. PF1-24]|uniref:hypothetical protein n=1 Tax=unclassified Enterococcus TaxID=2608891 RepID=UPI002472FA14|nr:MULTISPECIES: hypothetical protein [unclassified Enterococcus]MDH6364491.1 hypothetical protein [Enterococcus sp. PFB1-1]MDH6401632.1 hypothetical protein [Enterococcus sp. PF1-24]